MIRRKIYLVQLNSITLHIEFLAIDIRNKWTTRISVPISTVVADVRPVADHVIDAIAVWQFPLEEDYEVVRTDWHNFPLEVSECLADASLNSMT